MKIEIPTKFSLETILLILSIVIIVFDLFYYESSNTDNYWQYNVAKELLKDPSFLWKWDIRFALTGGARENVIYTFSYFPLVFIGYASLMFFGLAPKLLYIALIGILIILYKMDKKAAPLMFFSFMFVRNLIFGGNDGYVALFGLLCLYFFEKKPWASAVFAGLSVMVKGTGGFVIIAYFLSLLFFKRKYLLKGILIVFIITAPWFIRTFILNNSLTGWMGAEKSIGDYEYRISQPETVWWDTTGWFPLPFDILFFAGIIFLFIDLYRRRKVDVLNIFSITYIVIYIIAQLHLGFIMPLRYYLSVFPVMALVIARNLPHKSLKFVYIAGLIALIIWSYLAYEYSFNEISSQITPELCESIKDAVGDNPVWVKFLHQWYILFKCNLNPGYQNEAKYVVDLEKGEIYETNQTIQ